MSNEEFNEQDYEQDYEHFKRVVEVMEEAAHVNDGEGIVNALAIE